MIIVKSKNESGKFLESQKLQIGVADKLLVLSQSANTVHFSLPVQIVSNRVNINISDFDTFKKALRLLQLTGIDIEVVR